MIVHNCRSKAAGSPASPADRGARPTTANRSRSSPTASGGEVRQQPDLLQQQQQLDRLYPDAKAVR